MTNFAEKLAETGRAALAMATSGLIQQARPQHLPGLLRALRDTGTSPATLVSVAAVHTPEAPAIIDELGTMTYRELDATGARVAAGVVQRFGLPPGARIAVLCRNHRGFIVAAATAGRIGADLVFLNTEFSAPQLAGVLERIPADLIIADEEFLPLLDGTGTPVLLGWVDSTTPATPSMDELAATHGPMRLTRAGHSGNVTLLTSGTTGPPKGAPRSPNPLAFIGPVATILQRTPAHAGDPVLIAPPLFHALGFAMWGFACFLRSPVVLHRTFDPEATLAAIDKHHVAVVGAVPVMLQRLLALPEQRRTRYDHSSLHTVLSGGSALSPALASRFQDTFGDVLFNGYGASETGFASIATPADLRAAPGTVGRPTLGAPVRVLDDAGNPQPNGTTGRIFVGGPMVFPGYVGGGSKEVIGGLMSTGDLGHFDADGRLYVDGRADDMIVSGGENVYPAEVEDVLASHPDIADAVVIGVDDEDFGQRLVGYVVARGAQPQPDTLKQYVRDNLARYKVPREFVFLDELPRNATGKVVRRQLPRP